MTVGGEVVRDPARDVGEADAIAVDGRGVALERRHVVYALNKPAGYVRTAKDPQGRPTVVVAGRRAASGCTRSAGSTPTRPACSC